MTKNAILVFYIIFTSNLFAQTPVNEKYDNKDYRKGTNEVKTFYDIEGSPYYTIGFVDGIIYGKDIEDMTGKFRYNIYTDKIEYPINEKVFNLENPWKYSRFKISDTQFFYQKYEDGEKIKNGFLIVLAEGKYNLLLKKKVVLMAAEAAQPLQTAKLRRFESGDDLYFLGMNNEPAKKIKNIKSLKKTFPELAQIIDSYQGSTYIKKMSNLVDLINYINIQVSK